MMQQPAAATSQQPLPPPAFSSSCSARSSANSLRPAVARRPPTAPAHLTRCPPSGIVAAIAAVTPRHTPVSSCV